MMPGPCVTGRFGSFINVNRSTIWGIRVSAPSAWPDLPWSSWSATCETLHRWTQIAGKIQLALSPLVNHWWNVVFHVTARGLATLPIPYAALTFDIVFDFIDHRLVISLNDGLSEVIP